MTAGQPPSSKGSIASKSQAERMPVSKSQAERSDSHRNLRLERSDLGFTDAPPSLACRRFLFPLKRSRASTSTPTGWGWGAAGGGGHLATCSGGLAVSPQAAASAAGHNFEAGGLGGGGCCHSGEEDPPFEESMKMQPLAVSSKSAALPLVCVCVCTCRCALTLSPSLSLCLSLVPSHGSCHGASQRSCHGGVPRRVCVVQ